MAYEGLMVSVSGVRGRVGEALTPEVVSNEQHAAAVALNSAGFNVARSVGPALGGAVVAATGSGWAFLLNAVSFFGVIYFLYRWKRTPHAVEHSEGVCDFAWLPVCEGVGPGKVCSDPHGSVQHRCEFDARFATGDCSTSWSKRLWVAAGELRSGSIGGSGFVAADKSQGFH